MGRPLSSLLRWAPMPSKVSKARPTGSMALWQPLHWESLRWAVSFWRTVRLGPSPSLGSLVLTSGGGGGTAWHSSASRTKRPRLVGDGAVGWALMARKLAWPSTPRRGLAAGSGTRTNALGSAGAGRP